MCAGAVDRAVVAPRTRPPLCAAHNSNSNGAAGVCIIAVAMVKNIVLQYVVGSFSFAHSFEARKF